MWGLKRHRDMWRMKRENKETCGDWRDTETWRDWRDTEARGHAMKKQRDTCEECAPPLSFFEASVWSLIIIILVGRSLDMMHGLIFFRVRQDRQFVPANVWTTRVSCSAQWGYWRLSATDSWMSLSCFITVTVVFYHCHSLLLSITLGRTIRS